MYENNHKCEDKDINIPKTIEQYCEWMTEGDPRNSEKHKPECKDW